MKIKKRNWKFVYNTDNDKEILLFLFIIIEALSKIFKHSVHKWTKRLIWVAAYCKYRPEKFLTKHYGSKYKVVHNRRNYSVDFDFDKKSNPFRIHVWHLKCNSRQRNKHWFFKFKTINATCLKCCLFLNSHSIISKNTGMVVLRSSVSGTNVISRNGLTILWINRILLIPRNSSKLKVV